MAARSLRQREAAWIPRQLDLSRPDAHRSGKTGAVGRAGGVPGGPMASDQNGAEAHKRVALRQETERAGIDDRGAVQPQAPLPWHRLRERGAHGAGTDAGPQQEAACSAQQGEPPLRGNGGHGNRKDATHHSATPADRGTERARYRARPGAGIYAALLQAGAGRRDLVSRRSADALLEYRRRSAESLRGFRVGSVALPRPAQPGPLLCRNATENLRPLAYLQANAAAVDPLDVAPGRD